MKKKIGKHMQILNETKKRTKKPFIIIMILITCAICTLNYNRIAAFFTNIVSSSNIFTLDNDYTIIFDANGGTGTMANQKFFYSVPDNLNANTYTKTDKFFLGWNTMPNGRGTSYDNCQQVVSLVNQNHGTLTLYAQWGDGIAEINGTLYPTLQDAIDDVPTDNTQTTIILLASTSENLTVYDDQDIIFDLQNHTVTNDGHSAVFENHGTMAISNGTLIATAEHAALNNREGGVLRVSGGTIIGHERQAIYNEKGTVEISGNPIITTDSTIRAAVQNIGSSTLTITGGTITATNFYGVNNAGTMTIGVKDGSASKTSPEIRGLTYGVNSTTNYVWYDGIVKGGNGAFNNESRIQEIETGYRIVRKTEDIDGTTYRTAYQAISYTITFNANGGQVSEATRNCENGTSIGPLPTPTRAGYSFDGWYTAASGGTQIAENTIVTQDDEYFAHWTELQTAEVNGVIYNTLQGAVDAVRTNNVETTVTLLRDTSEAITVARNKNIVFDFQNYTLSNDGDNKVINNNGRIKITNGTITSSAGYAAIDVNSTGTLIMTGGSIITTGERQTIYNSKGRVEISGTAYLSSTTGIRGTIVNIQGGTVNIKGGTIVSHNQQAVDNAGTLTIGEQDGNINATTPVLQGKTYGVTNSGTFNFYDGILKGVTGVVSGTITNTEANSSQVTGTETIDGDTYQTMYLALN